jgi:NADH-quinone oxidoreductase subunit C
MGKTARELADQLASRFPGLFSGPMDYRGEITLTLSDPEQIVSVCEVAKKDFGFNYLVDITTIDNYGEDPRFTVVYHLYGYSHLQALRLKTGVGEEKCELPTVSGVWRAANWHEREAYDMMGVRFRGHPDLRRILMWEGYPDFPLRKDFPLAGRQSSVPEVAFTNPAPLAGGPFVTVAGGKDAIAREPRVRLPESDSLELNARVERRADIKDLHGEGKGPGPIHKK